MAYKDRIVMSIGGSLIVPNGGIDTKFLSELNKFIREQLAKNPNRQFFLVAGGGSTARHYQTAAKEIIGEIAPEDIDWLAIHATRLNAHLLRTIFRDLAHPTIIDDYEIIRKVSEPVVIASGWKPGWSTDFDAVLICEDYGVKSVINMSNIDRACDKDPKKFSDAKPIDRISWGNFRKLVGDVWIPGMNTPFDPIASKKAQELGLRVIILNGANVDNIRKYFDGEKFLGTVIE
ncbi:MAG: UMP kinase [Candidatus Levyibacteriota bacterium]|jgi:uridylate kinase